MDYEIFEEEVDGKTFYTVGRGHSALGQVYTTLGRAEEAKAFYEREDRRRARGTYES